LLSASLLPSIGRRLALTYYLQNRHAASIASFEVALRKDASLWTSLDLWTIYGQPSMRRFPLSTENVTSGMAFCSFASIYAPLHGTRRGGPGRAGFARRKGSLDGRCVSCDLNTSSLGDSLFRHLRPCTNPSHRSQLYPCVFLNDFEGFVSNPNFNLSSAIPPTCCSIRSGCS